MEAANMTTESKTRPQKLVFKRTAQNPGLSTKEKPTMATMAKSLLDAAGQIIKKGVKRVSKKEKARRASNSLPSFPSLAPQQPRLVPSVRFRLRGRPVPWAVSKAFTKYVHRSVESGRDQTLKPRVGEKRSTIDE